MSASYEQIKRIDRTCLRKIVEKEPSRSGNPLSRGADSTRAGALAGGAVTIVSFFPLLAVLDVNSGSFLSV